MKTKGILAVVTLVIMASVWSGCVRDVNQERQRIGLKLAGDISTRTYIEHDGNSMYVPSWSGGDQIGVFTALGPTREENNNEVFVNCEEGGATACFAGYLGEETTQGQDIELYSYSPYSCGEGGVFNDFRITLPSVQYPSLTPGGQASFDPHADIMASLPATTRISTSGPNDLVPLRFKRMMSYVRMIFEVDDSRISVDDKVQSVRFTVPDEVLTGEFSLDLAVPELKSSTEGSDHVIATYEGAAIQSLGDLVCWLVVNPFVINNDACADFTIEITTQRHVITKTVTAYAGARPIEFSAAGITPMTVNLDAGVAVAESGSGDKYYELVTDSRYVADGDFLIVGILEDEGIHRYYTLGEQQRTNFLARDISTLRDSNGRFRDDDAGTLAASEVRLTFLDNGFFTVQHKQLENSFFYTVSYLSRLVLADTNFSEACHWSVVLDGRGPTHFVSQIVDAEISEPYNTLQMDASGSTMVFSCYQTDYLLPVYLYRSSENEPGMPQLPQPALRVDRIDPHGFTLSWDPVENAVAYSVTLDGRDIGSRHMAAEYHFSDLEAQRAYTVTVKAIGDMVLGRDSYPSEIVVTTAREPIFKVNTDGITKVGVDAGSFKINVISTVDWSVGTDNPDFVPQCLSGSGDAAVTVSYTANPDPDHERSATITFTTGDESIPQAERELCVTVTQMKKFTESVIFSVGFESSEGFEPALLYSGSRYVGSVGSQWFAYYANVTSSTGAISGSQEMVLRLLYKTPESVPYTMMDFSVNGVTGMKFKARYTDFPFDLLVESRSGSGEWGGAKIYDLTMQPLEYEYTLDYITDDVRFRFTLISESATTRNSGIAIDDVAIYGIGQ